MHSSYRFCLVVAGAALAASGCGTTENEPLGQRRDAVDAPLPAAFCTIDVAGVDHDTETDYLPHVIQCENGGANLEALKAQAIAARSVAYYGMARDGTICDGTGCQVFSCGRTPEAIQLQAVQETSGQYLSYDDMLTYGFYVAGDRDVAPPSCIGTSGSTEHYVTYNEGRTGPDVEQTDLGWIGPPGFGQNRGCMSQWGSRCLENDRGYDHRGILRFFYGDDIQVLTAPGPCVAAGGSGGSGGTGAGGDAGSSGSGAEGGMGGTASGGTGGSTGGSGGSGGSGGTGGSGGSAGEAGGAGTAPGEWRFPEEPEDDGCSCTAVGTSRRSTSSLLGLALILLPWRLRRRRGNAAS